MRKGLPQPVVRQLLAAIDVRAPFGPRDYFQVVFALHTGLRVSELCGLCVRDVAEGGVPRTCLYVPESLAKFGKERWVPLNAVARKAVERVLAFNARRGFSVAPEAPLWCNRYGRPVGVRSVQYLFQALRKKAGLPRPCVPHQARHTFASNVLACTGNLRHVQELLGHASLRSVECYTSVPWPELEKATDAIARAV
jgi:site-specific recombinase XerD